jgi:glycosyltransferase involved in cell wall biosynthesis
MRIDQVLVGASPGDAITNDAFELRALLRDFGPSDIYARYYDASLAAEVHPLDAYQGRVEAGDDDVLCYHASIGEPDVMAFLRGRSERLVVVYHNISPAEGFRAYDPALAGLLDGGRLELAELAERTQLALADSEYNAAELRALGYRDVRVSPLVIDVGRLRSVPPHPGTARHLEEAVEGPVALFVGQLLPHKRPDLLIEAFHVLVTYLVPDAHLVLVGPGRLPVYRQAIETFAQELNLAQVWVTGSISDAELVAFYRRADAFVTASEHEGFCVPLVEAMAFEVPIVAREHAAIPETLGGAGIVLPPEDDPLLLAEAMAAVVTDPALADALRARGRARLEAFSPERARATFASHVKDFMR